MASQQEQLISPLESPSGGTPGSVYPQLSAAGRQTNFDEFEQ